MRCKERTLTYSWEYRVLLVNQVTGFEPDKVGSWIQHLHIDPGTQIGYISYFAIFTETTSKSTFKYITKFTRK